MTNTPPSPIRARISPRDLFPILATGLVATLLIVAADQIAQRMATDAATYTGGRSLLLAVALGFGLTLALAGMQGREEELTLRHAVTGWLKLLLVAGVVLIGVGEPPTQHRTIRLAVDLTGALGISLLLYRLRRRRA